jgi:hypothetical protein
LTQLIGCHKVAINKLLLMEAVMEELGELAACLDAT